MTDFQPPTYLEDAAFWLNHGCWTRKGKRAYTHSIASSLLSIAISLDRLAKVNDLQPSDPKATTGPSKAQP